MHTFRLPLTLFSLVLIGPLAGCSVPTDSLNDEFGVDESVESADDQLTIGSEEIVRACDHLSVIASWEGCNAPEKTATCVYNPPPGWVLVDHSVTVWSSSNGWFEASTLAGGLDLLSVQNASSAYDAAISIAAGYNNKTAVANLTSQQKSHVSQLKIYQTNKNTLSATVHAKPHGWCFDRKRGWEEVSVDARIRYLGAPDQCDLAHTLAIQYKLPVAEVLAHVGGC